MRFHRMSSCSSFLLMCVYVREVTGEPPWRLWGPVEVCWRSCKCCCLLSAWRRHHLPSSSSRSEGRTYPAHTDDGTSQGSPAGGQRLPGDVTVHTQVAATSVLSQSSPPGLEMGEETTPARQQNSSGPWLSWMPFSGTPASSPPSDHSAREYSMSRFPLQSHLGWK